jgi:hypothetical protein
MKIKYKGKPLDYLFSTWPIEDKRHGLRDSLGTVNKRANIKQKPKKTFCL